VESLRHECMVRAYQIRRHHKQHDDRHLTEHGGGLNVTIPCGGVCTACQNPVHCPRQGPPHTPTIRTADHVPTVDTVMMTKSDAEASTHDNNPPHHRMSMNSNICAVLSTPPPPTKGTMEGKVLGAGFHSLNNSRGTKQQRHKREGQQELLMLVAAQA